MNKVILFSTLFSITTFVVKAHDNLFVHPRISAISVDAFLAVNPLIDNVNLKTVIIPFNVEPLYNNLQNSFSLKNLSCADWFRLGSVCEDSPDRRCLAHFYNPLNSTEPWLKDPSVIKWVQGRDAIKWAMTGEPFTLYNYENQYSWKKAYEYYFQALSKDSRAEREIALGKTFFALGHVAHLLQDCSQPEHVRNDAHMINGTDTPLTGPLGHIIPMARWIENYGRDAVERMYVLPPTTVVETLDWRRAKFKKVREFWDRDLYNGEGDKAVLDADANSFKPGGDPTKLLGLAEFTNGNFIGCDATYKEIIDNINHKHYFPYPRIADTNLATLEKPGFERFDDNTFRSNVWKKSTIADELPNSNKTRTVLYVEKTTAGIPVQHHSIVNYSMFWSKKLGHDRGPSSAPVKANKSSVTINSTYVLKEYHEIALKKAASYSAGLLDYFFRGKIEVEGIALTNPNGGNPVRCRLTITNTSGEDLDLVGGGFLIMIENSATGSRVPASGATYVTSWNSLTSLLTNGQTLEMECDLPEGSGTSLKVIYRGNIGANPNGTPSDPMDLNNACTISEVNWIS